MNLFLEKNQSLSLALILNFLGNDTSVVNKIRSGYEVGNFELTSHGWNHENFSKLSEQSQTELLQKSNEKMNELFGVQSTVFVPPDFDFNNLTLDAMNKVGMTIISSWDNFYDGLNQSDLVTKIPNSDHKENNMIFHFPTTIQYSYFDVIKWNTYSVEQVLNDIDKSLSKYGYAVITLHPQAFVFTQDGNLVNSVNMTELNDLEHLLDSIKSRNIQTTGFYDLSQIRVKLLGNE